MKRGRNRFLTHWRNVITDTIRGFKRSWKRGLSGFGEGLRAGVRAILSAPRAIVRGIGQIVRAIGSGIGGIFHSVKQTPDDIRRSGQSLGRAIRNSGQQAAKSVKAARIQLKEQPEEFSKGFSGVLRRSRAWFGERRLWVKAILILILAGAVSAPFTIRPAYHAAISWRARSLLAAAQEIASTGDHDSAFDKAYAGYLLDHWDYSIVAATARLAHAADDPKSLELARQAASMPEAEPDLLKLFVSESLDAQQPVQARPFLNALTARHPEDPEVQALEIRYFALVGQRQRAFDLARAALVHANQDPALVSLYTDLAFATSDQNATAKAEVTLQSLAGQKNEAGLIALRSLIAHSADNASAQLRYARMIDANPVADRDDKLLATSVKLANKAISKANAEKIVRQLFNLNKIQDLRKLAAWLNNNGLTEETVSLIPQDQAVKDKQLFSTYLYAMINTGHDAAMLKLLRSPENLPINDVESLIFQAGILKSEGKNQAFETTAGLAIAKSDPTDFSFLDHSISFFRNNTLSIDFYQRVSKDPRFGLLGKARLLVLAYKIHREDILSELVANLKVDDLWNQPAALNVLAYMKLLRNEDIDNARRAAEHLVSVAPNQFAYRATLALAYLRSDRPKEALSVLTDHISLPDPLAPGLKAVFAAVLAANGQATQADTLSKTIKASQLSAAEKSFAQSMNIIGG